MSRGPASRKLSATVDVDDVRFVIEGVIGNEEEGEDPGSYDYPPFFVKREVCTAIELPDPWCRPEDFATWENDHDFPEIPESGARTRREALAVIPELVRAEEKVAHGRYRVFGQQR